ncbi:pyrrolo-quinoline quinone [Alloacidobacterium sp.]|uniref:pyrrolo-quinoline quinone n=1 Tax=Alloacidobacterium sp. TaxID=2951999 RepID=UPI002D79B1EC|nr:pyrrolo-quinoline quinone [Alloacidobacterium sp.]
MLTAGANEQTVVIASTALNGFSGKINVTLSGLPSGVTANPSSLSLSPGTPQNITLTAAANAAIGNATVTFTGTSSAITHAITLTLTINAAPVPIAGMDATTYHYDNARDGLNASETTLTPANVNSSTFGKINFFPTDGKVDAEPLYLSQLTINGASHNVLYAASEHGSVYAFDADTDVTLWQVSTLKSGETTSDDHGCGQISPEIGITSTPVIDRALSAIFVVAMSKDQSGAYHQRLHALNLTSGAEMEGGPVEITASYPGSGYGSQNGMQVFDPGQYAERVGLLLMNGSIFLGWTSHCDEDPYTGWLMMYNETTLQQTSVLNLTPNGPTTPHFENGEGSIWQSGAGLAADAQGNVYFLDANGSFDTTLNSGGFPSQGDFGNAFMRVSTANNKLAVADYFNTYNTVSQSTSDLDLGSGGVLLLPDVTDVTGVTRHLAVGAGKDGNIYVVDRDKMGKFNPSSNNIYQQVPNVLASEFGMAAYFNGTVYYGSINSKLQAFTLQSGKLSTTPSSQTSIAYTYPGTTPGISANGTQNGIIWAIENTSPAVLHAYDATNLAKELYNSSQASNGRDQFGNGNKFITPLIVNGKVFVGTPNGVAVFGLLH